MSTGKSLYTRTKLQPSINSFEKDVSSWFREERDGHMGKWQYFESNYASDPARGQALWDVWVASESNYYMLKNQAKLIDRHASDILKTVGDIQTIIDFGPGEHSAVFSNTLPFFKGADKRPEHYISVDLCKEYACQASEIVASMHPEVSTISRHQDFSKPLNLFTNGKSLALCMGGIIGNYEGFQQSGSPFNKLVKELSAFKSHLSQGDYIVFGADSNQKEQSLYESYDHPVHAEYEVNIMFKIKRDLLKHESGFNPEHWKYGMMWYPESYQFCHIVECTEDQTFIFNSQYFHFKKGKQLVVDNSFKIPVGIFQQASLRAGFKPEASFLDDQNCMALHLLKS